MKYFLLTTCVSSEHSFKYFYILRKKDKDLLKREDLLVAEFGLISEMVQSKKARPYQIPIEREPHINTVMVAPLTSNI